MHMKVSVVGAGYVGLVAGACLADSGTEVVCVDLDAAKIARLEAGEMPFYEPGLGELVTRGIAEKRLRFTTDLAAAVREASVIFIAVGTPTMSDGQADLGAVESAFDAICAAADGPKLVVMKSTVPVGTRDRLQERARARSKHAIEVASNPEFLKEGAAVDDFLRPDRVVAGTSDPDAQSVLAMIYAPFVRNEHPILFLTPRAAEMVKYASNALLAMRVSFINEMASLCEAVGVDVMDVRRGVAADRRIGHHFLYPGPGFGGSCFPKDLSALLALGREKDLPLDLIRATVSVNARQRHLLIEKLARIVGDLKGVKIGVWGLSFKPRTDDIRESPALPLLDALLERGAIVCVHDPAAMARVRAIYADRVQYASFPYDALEGARALVLVTEWGEYRNSDFERMRAMMADDPAIIDGRNLWDAERLRELGFAYAGIGR